MDELKDLMRNTQIAAPCSVKWDDMTGDDVARMCAQCNLHVVNTFMLTDEEVLAALQRIHQGERICMRVYRRADGTFMTRNCPVGIQRIRERIHKAATWLAAGLSMLVSMATSVAANAAPSQSTAAAGTSGINAAEGAKTAKKKKPLWQSKVTAAGCNETKKKKKGGASKIKQPDLLIMPTAGLPAPGPVPPPLSEQPPTTQPPSTQTPAPQTPANSDPALTTQDELKSKGVVEVKPSPPNSK